MNPADVIALWDGRVLEVHPPDRCGAGPCCIHSPSSHPLDTAPLNWRSDRRLMERICEHGIGHPDPDDLRYQHGQFGGRVSGIGVHGCDGCCRNASPANEQTDGNEPERCTERPEELNLAPLRKYHCPTCGCTCLAGIPHEITGHDQGCPYYQPTPTEDPW